MNYEVTHSERNGLLNREEMELEVNHAGEPTPSESDVRKKLAADQDLDPLTIEVDHIYSKTGRGFSTAHVKVFDEPVREETEDEEEAAEEASDSDERQVAVDTDTEAAESEESEEADEEQEAADETEDDDEAEAEEGDE